MTSRAAIERDERRRHRVYLDHLKDLGTLLREPGAGVRAGMPVGEIARSFRDSPSRRGRPWTPEEDAILVRLHDERVATRPIAARLRRSESAVRGRLRVLRQSNLPVAWRETGDHPRSPLAAGRM